jgi:hypothetical protein
MDSFLINTEPSLDGKTYVVTLSLSDDFALTLTPPRAMAYSNGLLAAVADAEYDHAILRQVTEKLGLDERTAMELVADVRKDRPAREAAGLRFVSGVSQRLREPFVQVQGVVSDRPYGQLDAAAARRHALHVIEAVPAADLDAGYYRTLRSLVGVDEGVARQCVEDIGAHRQPWTV